MEIAGRKWMSKPEPYIGLYVPVTVHREQSMKREKPTRCIN
jgi:hypothetical protein